MTTTPDTGEAASRQQAEEIVTMSTIIPTRSVLFILAALSFLLITALPVHAAATAQQKKVLIINSYHQGYKGSDDAVDGFRTTLLKAIPNTEIQTEYLDSINYSGKEFDSRILDLIKFKYQKRHFDLVFSTDDYAFNIVEKYRDSIFGTTPVVFCGTNSFDTSRLAGKHGFNGIDERPSFADTLALIFRLHPATTDVVVMHDTSVTGERNVAEFRRQAASLDDLARFTYLPGLRLEEMIRSVSRLSPGTVVIYFANRVQNEAGEPVPTGEVVQQLAAASKVPIYSGWQFLLGKGIVGGRLLDLREHGIASAHMAIRILSNASPATLTTFTPSPNRYMFDYKQMSRFGIKTSQLPEGSIVINEPCFFRTYKVALLSTTCAALLLALVAIFAKLLKSRRELKASLLELQEAQSELVATARKAGMAEIATNVLHNVGNVLNSVNISAGVLRGLVRDSKGQGLWHTVQLLKEHREHLGDYLENDAKGKLLPVYLERLAEALEAERSKITEEISQLSTRVDHLKDIVATQQSYAGAASLVEQVHVWDLFRDAVRINLEALDRRRITVVDQATQLPLLHLDKARVLQILVNLVSNAVHAMDGTPAGSAQLTLTAELKDNKQLRLSVKDEGEGIAPENLTRIFTHGFTTRKSGHGFGLHSCAVAAKEMGGTLTASSPGVGKGATFVLELPVDSAQVTPSVLPPTT